MVDSDATLMQIRGLVARGEYLTAYDMACGVDPASDLSVTERAELGYLRVLALARSGSPGRAGAELDALDVADGSLPPELAEDIAALGARLAKDRAFASSAPHRDAAAAEAARRYEAVFDRLGRPFACINAATLWCLAGDRARAGVLAERARLLARAELTHGIDAYWAEVTDAEASLLLGDFERVARCLRVAGELADADRGARATTRRQLRVLCEHLSVDAQAVLAPIANPLVMHYTGHAAVAVGASATLDAVALEQIHAAVRAWVSAHSVDVAYGSMASGADIIIAEALLARAVELRVVLPFEVEQFADLSVRPAGEDWVHRFEACLERAASVTITCDSSYLGDDTLFAFSSRVAMGQAAIRARELETAAVQLAVWDGVPSSHPAGTAFDVMAWQATGNETEVIAVERTPSVREESACSDLHMASRRPVRAMIFGDVEGFSRFRDEDMVDYVDEVLHRFAATIARAGAHVVDANTWGDALFVAFDDVAAAARCALALQSDLAGNDRFRMRMSTHVGPVLAMVDPIRGRPGTFGRELTRAARLEARTPPGEVYATSAFAALLAVDPHADVVPEYVGRAATAKRFETIPMYVLTER